MGLNCHNMSHTKIKSSRFILNGKWSFNGFSRESYSVLYTIVIPKLCITLYCILKPWSDDQTAYNNMSWVARWTPIKPCWTMTANKKKKNELNKLNANSRGRTRVAIAIVDVVIKWLKYKNKIPPSREYLGIIIISSIGRTRVSYFSDSIRLFFWIR